MIAASDQLTIIQSLHFNCYCINGQRKIIRVNRLDTNLDFFHCFKYLTLSLKEKRNKIDSSYDFRGFILQFERT